MFLLFAFLFSHSNRNSVSCWLMIIYLIWSQIFCIPTQIFRLFIKKSKISFKSKSRVARSISKQHPSCCLRAGPRSGPSNTSYCSIVRSCCQTKAPIYAPIQCFECLIHTNCILSSFMG